MLFTIFLLCLFLSAGIYLIACDAVHMPSMASTKAALQITQREKRNAHSLHAVIFNISTQLSKVIRLSEYSKRTMTATLQTAEIALTPETYLAKAIVNAGVKLSLAIPAAVILPILVPLIFMWSISALFDNIKEADKIVKKKREDIDNELPRFVATIEQELHASRDVLAMLEGYKASAGQVFRGELEITIAGMRSGSQEKALTRLETRIGSTMLSEVVRGLQAVLRGDNGVMHFTMLSHDFRQLEIQKLKMVAMKRPGKVKIFCYLMLGCFTITYFILMAVQVYSSVKQMF